ncbi:hypothetical protein BC832DRAFT_565870 [Gaertneriomyces semiglobifer]|nr:hypothetical protein BC832DRAFT_565870 [Gaertneriomyces semiglobifer]
MSPTRGVGWRALFGVATALAAEVSGALTSLDIVPSTSVSCTAAPATGYCDNQHPIHVVAGEQVILKWTRDDSTTDGIDIGFHASQEPEGITYIKKGVSATLPEYSFIMPPTTLSNFVFSASYNTPGSTPIFSPPLAAAKSKTDAEPPKDVSHIYVIIGLSSLAALVILISAWTWWKCHVRKRPGYQDRKYQRKLGVSVVRCKMQRMWRDSLQRMERRPSDDAENHRHVAMSPEDNEAQLPSPSSFQSSMRLPSQQSSNFPGHGCFRPSSDILPPTLCRTYTWQDKPRVPRPPSETGMDIRQENANPFSDPTAGWDDGWKRTSYKENDVLLDDASAIDVDLTVDSVSEGRSTGRTVV